MTTQLTWSTDKPTQEGWWFMKQRLIMDDGWTEGMPVYVKRMKTGELMQSDAGMYYPLEAFHARWAGPIPLPEEPASATAQGE